MLLTLKTRLDCTAERCFDEVQTTRLLLHIAQPLVHFTPITPPQLPARWEAREYEVAMHLLGCIPLGRQMVRISGQDHSQRDGHFSVELRDNGSGTLISRWDHRIFIQAAEQGCHYTDQVDIRAGWLTPLVWLFAWGFYKHRQQRWQQLVRRSFSYA
nr:hypothetical protein [uncultured Rhodoferax sp.]